ncbi:MAG: heavy metal transporter [Marinilabiliales bacterium]|nr:MAG: heavy metal transporter [Marinilabiliales bacterium]
MNIILFAENIKCHGCANTIVKNLKKKKDVEMAAVDVTEGKVSISYPGNEDRSEEFSDVLRSLGYPPIGENKLISNVKSYASCMIGRLSKDENENQK